MRIDQFSCQWNKSIEKVKLIEKEEINKWMKSCLKQFRFDMKWNDLFIFNLNCKEKEKSGWNFGENNSWFL